MATLKPIRLLIVDDHPVVRSGLVAMLASYSNLEVLGGMASGLAALAFREKRRVDVVLLDLRMTEMGGLETLLAMRKLSWPLKIIVLTSFETDNDICHAIMGGADGYLLKSSIDEEILTAITTVHSGTRYLPPYIALRFAECAPQERLSAAERELLSLIARGLEETEIAAILEIKPNMVRDRFDRLIDRMSKQGVPENFPVGSETRVTIEEVARRAGVSISTVSRVLNNTGAHTNETRLAVLRAVKDSGFELNRTAASLATLRGRLAKTKK
jgi:DNA-binding NarL/FixJ family response regulator